MPLFAWRKWWRRSSPRSQKLNKKPYFRKCFLEILEDRTLLSNAYTVNLASDNVINTGQQTGTFSGDLRWCIEQADLNPGSTIQFDPKVFPSSTNTTIHLSQGELQIAASMKIEGPGATTVTVSGTDGLNGKSGSRVFDVTTNVDLNNNPVIVTISGLTITDGNASPFYTPVVGNQGGDVFNGGNLTLQNDVVTNGFSIGNVGGPTGRGGAIFNAEGQGNTVLTLDNTIVQNSIAEGVKGGDVGGSYFRTAPSGGNGGPGAGGGIYNDASATLIVEDGSQILGNTALGGDGGHGGGGLTITAKGAPGGNGGNGGNAGLAEGGGIYNAGSLLITGNNLTSIVLSDNVAQGGKGGLGNHGGNGVDGARGGDGGNGGNGGSGGFADGGGIYNTGTVSFPSQVTVNYVNFLGNQALGGAGNDGGFAGHAGNGSKTVGGTGGHGGSGGAAGYAQGGGIFTAFGALSVSNSQFGLDANGVADQAIGGNGGNGNTSGQGGKSSGGIKIGNAGGPGPVGGAGGDAGYAKGGAVANLNGGGNVAFSNVFFISSLAKGGTGGNGSTGGNGNVGAVDDQGASKSTHNAGVGGSGGAGGAAGVGGDAVGGGVFNAVGSLTLATSTLLSNQALAGTGGNGGAGGVGGTGGGGTSKGSGGATGGHGGTGGAGGKGGKAQGGGFYNLVGSVTITNSNFAAISKGGIGNEAVGGSGGTGGTGGNGGQGGDGNKSPAGNGGNAGSGGIAGIAQLAEGGAGGNEGGNTSLTGDIFTSSLVQVGTGGGGGSGGTGGDGGNISGNAAGIGGNGGNAAAGGNSGPGLGGAIVVTASNLTISNSTFGGATADLANQIIGGAGGSGGTGGGWGHWGHGIGGYAWRTGFAPLAGNGGQGGLGASVYGGALDVGGKAQSVQITDSSFTFSSITSGNGGNGGQAGLFSFRGQNQGLNGPGGDAGLAQGGAVSITASSPQNATLSNVTIASSSATGGTGGKGAVNDLKSVTIGLISRSNGYGSIGGNGGSVQGIGLAAVNYNVTINDNSSFVGGFGQGGMGGAGGSATVPEPFTFQGGAAGRGGNVLGGGVFFSNNTANTLSFNFNGGSASNNQMNGGVGGNGGFAGASGQQSITGGAGGAGGRVQGGGIYILAGSKSVNTTALSNLLLNGNVLVGGTGGVGGAGYNAPGGQGGDVDGGSVFNSSANTKTASTFTLTGSTSAGNQLTGGIGGNAGSGTTPNGGAGGQGGNGGNVEGGGLFNGENTNLTVINSTFGGGSTNSSTPNANANILIGTRGGRGGDAGTPTGVTKNNGGNGGIGGSVEGGNVFVSGNSATFINDTIIYGQAASVGLGGAGGSGAGSGGKNGAPGTNGVGLAGGYYAAAGSTDTVGNTIIDLNSASVVPTVSPDVAGTFTSLGYNILGTGAGTNGFTKTGDQLNVTAAQLNLGPLIDNGGLTLTDALLNNSNGKGVSVAINAGGNTLVTNTANPWYNLFGPNPTDQRGPNFPRIDVGSNSVDVGAYEYNPPIINSLNPPSGLEQGGSFTLTINGSGFLPGTTVSFNGNVLTPDTITLSQITVTIPGPLPDEGTGSVPVLVSIPDGSGVPGEMTNSNTVPFAVTEGNTVTLTNPGTQSNNEGDIVAPGKIVIRSSDPDTTFSATGLPTGLSIDQTTGVISGTIDSRGAGGYTVTVNAIDEGVIQGSTTFTWNVADTTPPVLTAPPTQNNNEGDTITPVTVSAVDADPGTFSATGLPQGLSIDPNTGVISGTIGLRAAGTYTVSVTASDGSVVSQPVTFTWNVADTTPPTLTSPGNQSNNEGDTIKPLTINGVDADSFTITGLPTGLTYNAATGVISGTIDPYAATNGNAFQNFSVTVNASDNGFQSQPISFTWTVNDTTPPSFTQISNQTNNEGDIITNLATNPVDADPGTITAIGLPTGLSIEANTGVISGTIGANAAGTYSVTISATDGTGKVGTMQFQWTVDDTTPPTVTAPANQSNNEGDTISPLTIQAVDADSFTVAGLPTGLTYNAQTGVISGTIDAYAAGTYTVTVTAIDNGHQSLPVFFTWTVNDTTAPSITQPNDQISNEGQTITSLPIQATDADSFSATGLPTGLSINPTTGVISGIIDSRAADNSPYMVTVTATDTDNTTATNTASVKFTWTVNDTTPPTVTAPADQSNNEGDTITPLTINAVDADSFTIQGLPTGLTYNAQTGVISGTIDSRAVGNYTVSVTASDGSVVSQPVTFHWSVVDTTPPTLTAPPDQSNNEGDIIKPLSINAVDADSFTIQGLPTGLTYDSKSGVISGTIDSYAVTNGNASQSFLVTVTASDNGHPSQQISFTWTVNDTTPPSFNTPTEEVNNEGDIVHLATNPAGADPGTIKAINLPPGLSIDPNTGVISGTIGKQAAGGYLVSISGYDGTPSNSGGTTITWKVNDSIAPTLTNPGAQNSSDGQAINLTIHAGDADAYKATGLPAGLSIDPNHGVISGTVSAPPGTYNVTVTASDSGAASSVTFPWTVGQLSTSVVATNVHNSYVGLFQVETVTAQVTDPNGIPINAGAVTFLVNGETVVAPVVNGFASATIVTSLFSMDLTILLNDFFTHSLDAVYSDSAGIFGSSGVSVSEPAMLLDYLLFLESTSFGSLAQQLSQLQST